MRGRAAQHTDGDGDDIERNDWSHHSPYTASPLRADPRARAYFCSATILLHEQQEYYSVSIESLLPGPTRRRRWISRENDDDHDSGNQDKGGEGRSEWKPKVRLAWLGTQAQNTLSPEGVGR